MKKAEKYLLFLIYAATAVCGGYLAVNYVLPVLAPFIIAFILAAIMEPGVKYMVSAGVKRPCAAAVVTVFTLSAVICAVSYLAGRSVNAVSELISALPELSDLISELGKKAAQGLLRLNMRSDHAEKMLSAFTAALNTLPEKLSQRVLSAAARAAQSGAGAVLFGVTCAIGTYSFSASFPRVTEFLAMQPDERMGRRLRELWQDLKTSLGGLLRAELILMIITFFQLLALFIALKTERPVFSAVITAVVDALPVFGTGAILLPWALYSFVSGQSRKGIWLIAGWAVTVLVRNCLQAKLLGDRIGLDPLVSLLAIYTGWCACGVWGMLIFPLLFVAIIGLNERGIIHLWKSK